MKRPGNICVTCYNKHELVGTNAVRCYARGGRLMQLPETCSCHKPITASDVFETLGKAFGVDHEAVLAEVRANLAKLDSCTRHEFVGLEESSLGKTKGGGSVFRDYQCTSCGGKVRASEASWYRRGLEHGGTKP